MPFTTHSKDLMLNTLPSTLYTSAHYGNPTNAGINEVSGTGYARIAITLDAASNEARPSSTTATLVIPSNFDVTYIGYWDAITGGNFMGYKAITEENFPNGGNLVVESHNFLLDLD